MGIENKMLIDGYWPDEDEDYNREMNIMQSKKTCGGTHYKI